MLKSIEQMARETIEHYMRPLILNGRKVTDGWPVDVAARKAAAAHPNFKSEIARVAAVLAAERGE